MKNDDDNKKNNDGGDFEDGIALKTRTRTKKPSMYKVLMLNDDLSILELDCSLCPDRQMVHKDYRLSHRRCNEYFR